MKALTNFGVLIAYYATWRNIIHYDRKREREGGGLRLGSELSVQRSWPVAMDVVSFVLRPFVQGASQSSLHFSQNSQADQNKFTMI